MTRKERYQFRVANRRCIDCNAGLQEDDHRRCVECAEKREESLAKYARTHRAELLARNKGRASREQHREWSRVRRARNLAEGRCCACRKFALPGMTYCAKHLEAQRVRSLNSWRRKNGKPSVAEVPSLRRKSA